MSKPKNTRQTGTLTFVLCLAIGTVIGVSIGIPNQNPVLIVGGPVFGLLAGLAGVLLLREPQDV